MAAWTGIVLLSSHDIRDHQVFELAATDKLIIDTDEGGVTLEPGEPGKVTVDRKITDSINGPDPTWSLEGNRLKLRVNCPAAFGIGCDGSYRIKVPLDVPLEVFTDNGGIDASGLRQDMKFSTDNGHIAISDSVAANLVLNTDNGGINLARVSTDRVRATTDNGGVRIRLDKAPTEVTVRTDNGGVHVTVPEDDNTYRVDVDIDNGAPHLIDSDSRSNRSITVRTDNGGVDVDRAVIR
ncbi:DUF4097 family beta strand repeat-containing protein [Embleya sp. NBC_00896]|uniref:DUF4097 family beta strand repeat-containing protein n=1 Tax=Embleya sp. NBC_00896 TaxID=2975961 RepID=UPI003866AE14|nr:DUF4097 domain-containing protein [Embleya sp. NBC_00896]